MFNIGIFDRIVRAAAGAALILVPLLSGWSLWTNIVALSISEILGIVLLATAVIGFCPIYAALGLSSKRAPTRTTTR